MDVKEQASGLYAQTMAERSFATMSFDPSFTSESGGTMRDVNSPDINTEDFNAAVDYLSTLDEVDADGIGIIVICGWGGYALDAAAIDTRIKATVTSTRYDMSIVTANGYFDAENSEESLYQKRVEMNEQRVKDYKMGNYAHGEEVNPKPTEDSPFFVKDYYDYYKTPRGYHSGSLNFNTGWMSSRLTR